MDFRDLWGGFPKRLKLKCLNSLVNQVVPKVEVIEVHIGTLMSVQAFTFTDLDCRN